MIELRKKIQYVKGVGPKRAQKLKKININTIEDIMFYFPRTYEDRRQINKINDCIEGQKVNLKVCVSGTPIISRPRRGLSIIKLLVRDDTGFAYLVWFNQEYLKNIFKKDETIRVSGKVKNSYGQIQINNPEYRKEDGNFQKVRKIVPIYPLTEKLTNNEMIKIVSNVLDEYLQYVEEILPLDVVRELNFWSKEDSLNNIHFPNDRNSYVKSKERLAFEELLLLQLGLMVIKNKHNKDKAGIKFLKVTEIDEFIKSLPFKLTRAQIKVYKEIEKDMESERPMNRLVQGDVGSGKTIIAILAMLKAVRSGYQAVMMAPTEILATQHYESINETLRNHNIKCEILVGSIPNKRKGKILEKMKDGEIDILVGTHAIIQNGVEFKNLGLAITDEQHRFGVRQRAALKQKGQNPDVLVMTATPIPRTLALILYGDLDISIIDELPPGRKSIKTYTVIKSMKKKVYDFVNKQIKEGRQAYIVCPLVEESEELSIQSATELYEMLKSSYFHQYKLGLLHGKMKSKDKEDIMENFKNGKIHILISTTVIEVGVNVPNANIIVIENAERFGLAQLHQLRGRVGRGNHQSYCILINESNSEVSKERMKIMESTTNGFIISEKDLEIRGPGDFFGTRQHGLPELKIANIFTDIRLLKLAQNISKKILKEDPLLDSIKYSKLKEEILFMFKDKIKNISLN